MKGGTYVDPHKTTVAEFLDRWLEHIKPNVSPRTHERYAEIATKNLAPLLGTVILTKLRRSRFRRPTPKRSPAAAGSREGRAFGAHGPSHAPRAAPSLRKPCGGDCWCAIPADLEKRTAESRARSRWKCLDADGTVELIEAARGDGLFVPVLLGVLCGLRRGEIVALRWRSVDLERGQIAVAPDRADDDRHPGEGNEIGRSRTVALPATIIEELRQHRLRQAEELLRLGVRLDR